MDLVYWIDYIDKFDIGHRIPPYDEQGIVQYYNLDIILLFCISVTLCKALITYLCCPNKPSQTSNTSVSDNKQKTD